jgi:acetylornithine aminotransferase
MLGIGLAEGLDARAVAAGLLERGLIVNPPGPRTLRLLPPLIIGEAEVEEAVEKIRAELAGDAS